MNKYKIVKSPNYNYHCNRENGQFIRWGKDFDDDPIMAPAPEIADIEISTICHQNCKFCYKSNTPDGKNMDLETFKILFHKFPKTVCQFALGVGSLDANPDLYKIMEYCRNNDYNYVVPNITINGYHLTDYHVDRLSNLVGAISVSHYNDDVCYDAVQKLTANIKQVNIHKLVSLETYESCFKLMNDSKNDSRLSKLNSIVFLLLKPRGNRNTLHGLNNIEEYKRLVDYALDNDVRIGFDSCSCSMFLKSVRDRKEYELFKTMSEPCESFGLFSCYINVSGEYFPCSFAEGVGEWKDGISVLKCYDFVQDIWNSEKVKKWREISLKCIDCHGCRVCPIFPEINL
jgi:hypothetical protein